MKPATAPNLGEPPHPVLLEVRRLQRDAREAKRESTRQRNKARELLERCRQLCEKYGIEFEMKGVDDSHGRQETPT